jgi:hypothetical protein
MRPSIGQKTPRIRVDWQELVMGQKRVLVVSQWFCRSIRVPDAFAKNTGLQILATIERLKAMVENGELGQLFYITSNRLNLGKDST